MLRKRLTLRPLAASAGIRENGGERFGYMRPDTDDSRWPQVLVPGSFDLQNENLCFYQGKVWYRTTFPTPAGWQGQRVLITFQGANCRTRAWLNGTFLGENRDPFLPFSFSVDPHLVADGPNVLCVCVDNEPYPEDLPGRHIGWRNFGGILREVTLTATARSYVESAWITAEPDGRFKLAYSLRNEDCDDVAGFFGRHAGRGRLDSSRPRDRDTRSVGQVWRAGGRRYRGGGCRRYGLDAGHAEAVCRAHGVATGERRADSTDVKFGFRKIETRGHGSTVERQEDFFLLGFNRHEDSPRTDMAFDADTMRRDLELMKDSGCNFIRSATTRIIPPNWTCAMNSACWPWMKSPTISGMMTRRASITRRARRRRSGKLRKMIGA